MYVYRKGELQFALTSYLAGMKPKRRSIRLPGYDYASAGWYFVTIICHKRQHLFGEVCHGQMVLNEAGDLVEKWWNKIPEKFPDIELGDYQIMPNHFHAIVINVGADPCVGPSLPVTPDTVVSQQEIAGFSNQGEHAGSPLHRVIQWFKTMVTNEFIRNVKQLGWKPFEDKFWQRNYYEHIIRNEESYQKIAAYICNNPAQWQEDEYFR